MISTRGRGRLPTIGARQDAAAAGKHHGDRDLVKRHQQRMAIFAGIVPAGLQGRRQRRQEQFGNDADARQHLPQHDQRDDDEAAQRG